MADPLKLQVLKALTAHIEGIDGTDDAHRGFDLRDCVFRGFNRHGEEAPPTLVNIIEAPRPDPGRTGGELDANRKWDWTLLLQAWTDKDIDLQNPTDVAYLLEDALLARLNMLIAMDSMMGMPKYPEVYLLGRLITELSCGPGVVRPPADNLTSKAVLYLPVRIGLATVG